MKQPSCEGGYQKESFFPKSHYRTGFRGQLKLRGIVYMGLGHTALGLPSSEAAFPPLLARTPLPELGPSFLKSFFCNTFEIGQ